MHVGPSQLAWLKPELTRPLGLVEDTVLIATPNAFVKEQLETRLRPLVIHALSRELGRPIQLAVTVDPRPASPQEHPLGPAELAAFGDGSARGAHVGDAPDAVAPGHVAGLAPGGMGSGSPPRGRSAATAAAGAAGAVPLRVDRMAVAGGAGDAARPAVLQPPIAATSSFPALPVAPARVGRPHRHVTARPAIAASSPSKGSTGSMGNRAGRGNRDSSTSSRSARPPRASTPSTRSRRSSSAAATGSRTRPPSRSPRPPPRPTTRCSSTATRAWGRRTCCTRSATTPRRSTTASRCAT